MRWQPPERLEGRPGAFSADVYAFAISVCEVSGVNWYQLPLMPDSSTPRRSRSGMTPTIMSVTRFLPGCARRNRTRCHTNFGTWCKIAGPRTRAHVRGCLRRSIDSPGCARRNRSARRRRIRVSIRRGINMPWHCGGSSGNVALPSMYICTQLIRAVASESTESATSHVAPDGTQQ
jgi:hypothetical protein